MKKLIVTALGALLVTGSAFAAEGVAEDVAKEIASSIEFSGTIEIEAGLAREDYNGAPDVDSSDLVLATFDLGVEAKAAENLNVTGLFCYDEDEGVIVDEAFVTYARDAHEVTLGLVYLPFGEYPSHMLTDPLTLELGETSDAAAVVGYDMGAIKVEAFLYNGNAQRGNFAANEVEESHIKDFGVAVDATLSEALTVGASLISDIADSDFELAAGTNNVYYHRVPGLSAYAVYNMGKVEILGEFVAAVEEFDGKEAGLLADAQPMAWNAEVAYQVNDGFSIAGAVGGTDEVAGLPEFFFGFCASWGLWENVSFSAEAASQSYDDTYGGRLDSVDVITAQLAVEF